MFSPKAQAVATHSTGITGTFLREWPCLFLSEGKLTGSHDCFAAPAAHSK